jgi:precorrin-6A/cobalt-precorrin-6A reductase
MSTPLPAVLVLGGTSEARLLAERLVQEFSGSLRVISSLAGRTAEPVPLAGEVRRGGFGGAAGLERYLRELRPRALIDATHPFAAVISRNAAAAAEAASVPRLVLARPPWQPTKGDRWIEVADAAAAAATLVAFGPRVWLTLGGADVAAFSVLADRWFLIRRVDPPTTALPLAQAELILARGPFRLEDERRLIAVHRPDVLVCRASGGVATAPKLEAAREAGLPVIMICRPPPPPGPTAENPGQVVEWLRSKLGP